jgi:predicted DNA-binding transcriptional regulator YafY
MLTLLQIQRTWSGQQLADRLGVSTRIVRRDVDMLRDLGYPVNAVKGITGGYRLGAGAQLPPLLLDDDEAVAIAITLRTAASSNVTGIGETAPRALIKLEQLLPSRLRHRINAVRQTSACVARGSPARQDRLSAEARRIRASDAATGQCSSSTGPSRPLTTHLADPDRLAGGTSEMARLQAGYWRSLRT